MVRECRQKNHATVDLTHSFASSQKGKKEKPCVKLQCDSLGVFTWPSHCLKHSLRFRVSACNIERKFSPSAFRAAGLCCLVCMGGTQTVDQCALHCSVPNTFVSRLIWERVPHSMWTKYVNIDPGKDTFYFCHCTSSFFPSYYTHIMSHTINIHIYWIVQQNKRVEEK